MNSGAECIAQRFLLKIIFNTMANGPIAFSLPKYQLKLKKWDELKHLVFLPKHIETNEEMILLYHEDVITNAK